MKAENPNNSRNVAQFFVKNRQIAWVALFATLAWGVFGYMNMPKRKDPDIPVRIALAITPWPGISADKVEQLVTRKVEQAVTGNSKVDRVESTTQDNISVVQVRLLGQHQEHPAGVSGHWTTTEPGHGPSRRCGTDHLDQRFRRHGSADADRRQSDGPGP